MLSLTQATEQRIGLWATLALLFALPTHVIASERNQVSVPVLRQKAGLVGNLAENDLHADPTGGRIRFSYGRGQGSFAFSLTERTLSPEGPAIPRTAKAGTSIEPPPGLLTLASAQKVLVTQDGRLLISTHRDGTIRWHATSDGRHLLSFFPHPDRHRWIVWTPSGYYDAAIGADDLVGWQVSRPNGEKSDFFPLAVVREKYYRPDLISRILFVQDEQRTLEQVNAELGRKEETLPLTKLLPPVVRILSPQPFSISKEAHIQVRVAVRSPFGEPVTAVRPVVRGQNTQGRGMLVQTASIQAGLHASDEEIYTLEVDLPAEDVTVAVLAETAHAQSTPTLLGLRWGGAKKTGVVLRPDLYLLAIGVSEYKQRRLRLDFAAKDAQDLATAFVAQKGQLYRKVEIHVLTDSKATKNEIEKGLLWLRRSTTSNDVAAVFLAGHGINDAGSGKYFFLPHEAEPGDPATLLSGDTLQTALGKLAGKALLFLDSCHAGNLRGASSRGDLALLTHQLASVDSGVVVYAASTGKEQSRESARWGNGAFTKALVEGIGGKADLRGSGKITVSNLESYVSERVRELTQDEQTPTSAKPGTVPDFLVAEVHVRYPLARKWWFWSMVGLVAAGALAGATTGILTSQDNSPILDFSRGR